jgi:hypothetical protein
MIHVVRNHLYGFFWHVATNVQWKISTNGRITAQESQDGNDGSTRLKHQPKYEEAKIHEDKQWKYQTQHRQPWVAYWIEMVGKTRQQHDEYRSYVSSRD